MMELSLISTFTKAGWAVFTWFRPNAQAGKKPQASSPSAIPAAESEPKSQPLPAFDCHSRLLELMRLVNDQLRNESPRKTPAILAREMGFSRTGEFDGFLAGKVEPTHAQLEKLCAITGAHPGWLIDGLAVAPFKPTEAHVISPMEWVERLVELDPVELIFVREKHPADGWSGLVAVLKCGRHIVFPTTFAVFDNHNETQGAVYDYYGLLKTAHARFRYASQRSILLDKPVFDALIAGRVYPQSVLERHGADWVRDFLWLPDSHFPGREESLEKQYGRDFVRARESAAFMEGSRWWYTEHAIAKREAERDAERRRRQEWQNRRDCGA